MLHMEIIQERLEREYDLDLITTAPTVVYEVLKTDGSTIQIDNPSKLPPPNEIVEIREPIIDANILVPQDYLGAVMTLCVEKRGIQKNMQYMGGQVSLLRVALERNRIGLFRSSQIRQSRLRVVRLRVQALPGAAGQTGHPHQRRARRCLSLIVHRDISQTRGRDLVERMKI